MVSLAEESLEYARLCEFATAFPLTLSLCLRERSPRTLIAPCAHEPVFEHSFISNNLRVRFMGREQRASDRCLADTRLANSGTGVSERRWNILPLPKGEGRGEGEPRVANHTVH